MTLQVEEVLRRVRKMEEEILDRHRAVLQRSSTDNRTDAATLSSSDPEAERAPSPPRVALGFRSPYKKDVRKEEKREEVTKSPEKTLVYVAERMEEASRILGTSSHSDPCLS